MPYKDKEIAKTAVRDRQRRHRQGVTQGGVTGQGVTWETLPLGDIKSALPRDIVSYIENVAGKYGLLEQRLRRAYKYQVWHEANFINGIHKDSKYRQFLKGDFLEATR